MIFRTYVWILLSISGALFSLVVALNISVDPFGVVGTATIKGFNLVKTELIHNDRVSKGWLAHRFRPDALVLGNSRALFGVPLNHSAWNGYRVFNGSLTGGYLGEAIEFLEYVHHRHPVRRVVINIDEGNFRAKGNVKFRYVDGRYECSLRGVWIRQHDLLYAVLSDRAVLSSLRTLRAQNGISELRDTSIIRSDGSPDPSAFQLSVAMQGGPPGSFLAQERSSITNRLRAGPISRMPISEINAAKAAFLSLLEFSRRNAIELVIFIPPVHARYYDLMDLTGTWEDITTIREWVVALVEAEARANNAQPFSVWDFGGFHRYSMQPVHRIQSTDGGDLWFYESSHFKPLLGEVILDRALGGAKAADPDKPFGVRLTSQSVAARVATMRADLRLWRIDFPEDSSEIARLVENARALTSSPSGGSALTDERSPRHWRHVAAKPLRKVGTRLSDQTSRERRQLPTRPASHPIYAG